MTTNEILNLDFREERSQQIIQKALRQIKPLAKCSEEEDVPFELLERVVLVICRKYDVFVREISPDTHGGNDYIVWRMTFIKESNLSMLGQVFGVSMYEVMTKACISLHSMTRKGTIGIRKPTTVEKQRERQLRKVKEKEGQPGED